MQNIFDPHNALSLLVLLNCHSSTEDMVTNIPFKAADPPRLSSFSGATLEVSVSPHLS